MIDRPTEPPFNDGWQGEADVTWGDRPGIVASLLRYRVIMVAATLLGAVAGYGIAQLLPVRYQADAVLILSDPGAAGVLGGGEALEAGDRQVYLDKQADIMTSTVVLERALELLGSPQSPRDVRDELTVQPSANLANISIAATSTDPRSAAALANAVGAAYEQVTDERAAADADRAIASLEELRDRYQADFDASPTSADGQLTARQRQLAGQIADVQQREQDITTQAAVYASGVEYFEQAEPPTSPSQPKPKLGAVLGGLVGLLAAGAWAWWAAARDPRAEDRGEPARILEAPLLGEVPPQRTPPMATGEPTTPGLDPALEDAYHFIVASMEHELAGVGGTAIAVTSVGPGDSKTSAVLQIGNAASQENREVLLIDADVRLRHLSECVGPAPVAAGRTSQQPRPRQRAGRGRWAPLPRDEPVGAQDYLDRLVSTDSGMVLPVASNPTNPHRPPATDRAVDLRHALLHRRDVRPRPDRHTRPAGLLRRPHRGQTSRRSPTRRLPPGRPQRPTRRPRPPRLRQNPPHRLRLHPTPQPRSPQEGRHRAGGTTLNEANGAATRVAALLAAYNRRTLTLACLHSLHAQRRPRLRRG